jgi:hypothetical protein
MTGAKTYSVVRFAADGHSGEYVPYGESDGQVLASGLSLAEAKRLANKGYGSFAPEGEGELIAYHDSDREGCGGYVVREDR